MAPYAPPPAKKTVGPLDFGASKEKLVQSLASKPKNDIAPDEKKKKVVAQVLDPNKDLRKAINPMQTIGEKFSTGVSPMVNPVPQTVEQKPMMNFISETAPASESSSIFGIPKANAGENLLNTYMSDPGISDSGKNKMKTDIESGKLTTEKAEQIITQIYKDKPQEKQEMGMWDEFRGKAREGLLGTVSEFQKQQADLDEKDSDRNSVTKFIQKAGAGAKIIGDLAGAGISTVTPDIVKETFGDIGKGISEATPDMVKEGLNYSGRKIGDAYNFVEKKFPETVATLEGGLNVASLIPGLGAGAKGGKIAIDKIGDIVPKMDDVAKSVQSQRGSIKFGKGFTESGEEIDLPEKSTKDTIKGKLFDTPVKKLEVENALGETPLSRLAGRAVMPTSGGKSSTALLKKLGTPEQGMKKIWELVRTGKIDGNLDTMPDTAKAIVDGLSKYGKEIGDMRSKTSGQILDTTEVAKIAENVIRSDMKTVVSGPGYSELSRFYEDLNKTNKFEDIWNLKTDLGAEMTALQRQGFGGKTTYRAMSDMNDALDKRLNEFLLESPEITGPDLVKYKEALDTYSKLRNISEDFLKSTIVDSRKSAMSFPEQLSLIQTGYDVLTNPIGSLGKGASFITKEISERNSREGSMKQFFDAMDRLSRERKGPDMIPIPTQPTIGEAFDLKNK